MIQIRIPEPLMLGKRMPLLVKQHVPCLSRKDLFAD
jgi:hypothetical protein